MIRGRCPICAKAYEIQTLSDLPAFPFCTERCRMVDLGRWIDGDYALPSGAADKTADPDDGEVTEAEEEMDD